MANILTKEEKNRETAVMMNQNSLKNQKDIIFINQIQFILNFEEFFEKKDIIFYKRETNNYTVFLLPYRIKDINVKFTIHLTIFKHDSLCRMSFSEKLNDEKDFSKELLEINSTLMDGSLSVAPNSNNVSFNINFVANDEKNVEMIYNDKIYLCFSVILKLYNKNIIDKSSTVDKYEN